MTKVDAFLDVTGLKFEDLQRFLSLSFVNPGGTIVIQNLDSSCDPAQKRLQVLDANALDRFHRFLRLWRKLGWKMWEVDLVIQVLGGGALDANLPPLLYPFLRDTESIPTAQRRAALRILRQHQHCFEIHRSLQEARAIAV